MDSTEKKVWGEMKPLLLQVVKQAEITAFMKRNRCFTHEDIRNITLTNDDKAKVEAFFDVVQDRCGNAFETYVNFLEGFDNLKPFARNLIQRLEDARKLERMEAKQKVCLDKKYYLYVDQRPS